MTTQQDEINLAGTPRGIPVCGLGSIAMSVFLTVVAPPAWWFLLFGAMGGVVVGIVKIATTRYRILSTLSGGSRGGLFGHDTQEERPVTRPRLRRRALCRT